MTYFLVFAAIVPVFLVLTAWGAGLLLSSIITYECIKDAFIIRVFRRTVWRVRYADIVSIRRLSVFQALLRPFAAHLGTSLFRSRVIIRRRNGIGAIVTPPNVDAFITGILNRVQEHREGSFK
jgi:hypothetical protein